MANLEVAYVAPVDRPLEWTSYVVGIGVGASVVGVALAAAIALRRAALPSWCAGRARLAEVVIAIAVLVVPSQLLGSVGALELRWILLATTCVGVGLVLGTRRSRMRNRVWRSPRCDAHQPTSEVVAAGMATAVVGAKWLTSVVSSYLHGMTHPDTLLYHGPYAAQFVQRAGWMHELEFGAESQKWYPHNSELVHAVAVMPFDRDVLAPLINLGWAALLLLASWCIAQRFGRGALGLLAGLVVLSVPTIAGTQPGQASSDLMAAALLVSAIALLLEAELEPGPTLLAGVAAGLAIGTKMTVIAPALGATIVLAVACAHARRARAMIAWLVGVVVLGGYWFLRDWIVVGHPLPWFDLHLGPVTFDAVARETGAPISRYIGHWDVWRSEFLPGLTTGLGYAWPVVLVVVVAGAVFAIVCGSTLLEKGLGAVVPFGIVVYAFTPLTADLYGGAFPFNLRYLAPTLALGVALFVAYAPLSGERTRRAACIGVLVLVCASALSPNNPGDLVPNWPLDEVSSGAAVLLVTTAMALAIGFTVRPRSRVARAGVRVVVVLIVLIDGWFVQTRYLEGRYRSPDLIAADIDALLAGTQNSTVAFIGASEAYPLYGFDLSNRVDQMLKRRTAKRIETCAAWRRATRGYDYVVLSIPQLGIMEYFLPPDDWFDTDPASKELATEGRARLYRVDGNLDPRGCAADEP